MVGNRTIVRICIAIGLLNLLLVSGLAAGGILNSVQTETKEFYVQESAEFRIELPADTDRPFVGELIVDADAYYNTVIRAENGVTIYPPADAYTNYIQKYHYAPAVVLLFALLALFGYGTFKLLLLVASIVAVVGGSYAILRAEITAREFKVSNRKILIIAVAAAGFGPMVSNYKVGQITPFIFAAIAGCWYWYRKDSDTFAGAALTIAALTKPYFLAPAAILISRKHFKGIAGLIGGIGAGFAIGVAAFGVDTLIRYLAILIEFAVGSETGGVGGITEWSVESVFPFFSMGPITTVGRLLAAGGFALLWIQYLRSGSRVHNGAGVFAGSIVMVMFVIQGASNMDLATSLAAYLVLGPQLYGRSREFGLLGLSFLLTTVHPYAMELLVGSGHVNLTNIISGSLQPLLQLLQPATYGLYILAGLSVLVVFQPNDEPGAIYSGNSNL
jgi:hypothetical protein